jgi:hypothetical protein
MTNVHLHTIFLEYRGGTYISQVRSVGPSEAVRHWADTLSDDDLKGWNLRREELLSVIQSGNLVPLSDRINVWCVSGIGENDEQLIVNVVTTAEN